MQEPVIINLIVDTETEPVVPSEYRTTGRVTVLDEAGLLKLVTGQRVNKDVLVNEKLSEEEDEKPLPRDEKADHGYWVGAQRMQDLVNLLPDQARKFTVLPSLDIFASPAELAQVRTVEQSLKSAWLEGDGPITVTVYGIQNSDDVFRQVTETDEK